MLFHDENSFRLEKSIVILLYGSEVTGFEKHDILEKLCIQFYKIILKAK